MTLLGTLSKTAATASVVQIDAANFSVSPIAGNLIVLHIANDDANAPCTPAWSPPTQGSGSQTFTLKKQSPNFTEAGITLWECVCTGTPGTNMATFSWSDTSPWSISAVVYSGGTTHYSNVATASGTTSPVIASTGSTGDDLITWFTEYGTTANPTTPGIPSGQTNLASTVQAFHPSGAVRMAYETLGTPGTRSTTYTGGGTNTNYGVAVAITPPVNANNTILLV